MTLQKLENETYLDFKYRVLIDKVNGDIDSNWDDIEKALHIGMAKDSIRKGSVFLPEFKEYLINKFANNEDLPKYKENIELKADGSTTSDKLITIAKSQDITKEFLLDAHGFDKTQFELVSAKNSIWNVSAGKDPNKTLYSSKISVKPKESGFDINKFVEKLKDSTAISNLQYAKNVDGENMLVIPYFDMHFGIATLDTYKEVLNKTINKIKSKHWDKILVVFGQDLLHTDGFSGQTSSGTIIGSIDMERAWLDAHIFYTTIFNNAIENANSVDSVFSNGNHDKSMGWAFGKLLEHQYPLVNFDSEMKQFKGYKWKDIFLGLTHGDKGGNRIFEVFLAEYGHMITGSKTKEILTGHVHHQKTIDKFGLVHKTLGTGVPSDDYHSTNGFVGAQKQFQMLEYNSEYPEAVYYV